MGSHSIRSKNTLVYMQNNGEWLGSEFSSSLLSCNANANEMESLINHSVNFIFRNHKNFPIRWKDIMTNRLLSDESAEGELIGDEIREKCFIIDDVHFRGGYIGGSNNNNKIVRSPELFENHLPVLLDKKNDIVMAICTFDDGYHNCDVEMRKGKLDDIRKYQNIITKMMIGKEKNRWNDSPNRKKRIIMESLSQISKRVGL